MFSSVGARVVSRADGSSEELRWRWGTKYRERKMGSFAGCRSGAVVVGSRGGAGRECWT